MKNTYGITLVETLIAVALTGIITLGLLFFLRIGMNRYALFSERSQIYKEASRIMDMIRSDLSTIRAVTDMEYFNNLNGDDYFNSFYKPGTSTQWKDDMIIPVDDPSTFHLREDFYPPQDDASTFFQESLLNYENLPYGITYDYVFGITNSGDADAIYFRGSVTNGDKRVPANICYRLFRKRISRTEEDTGIDGNADEEEARFHPVANPDPAQDNFNPTFNVTGTEGNAFFDRSERDQNGNGLVDRTYTFELQRIITVMEDEKGDFGIDGVPDSQEPGFNPITNPDPNGDNFHALTNPYGTEGNGRTDKIPATRGEILSVSVDAFNIFYYDRRTRQYREPESTVKRFSYPPDVGLVGGFDSGTPAWFSFGDMSTEIFVEAGAQISSIVSPGDYIFLWGKGVAFNTYPVLDVDTALKRVLFGGIPSPPGTDAAIQFIPAGRFDEDGWLSCPQVKDGFINLKAGDRVFIQQWNRNATDFIVQPDLYTIMDRRGGKLLLDLKGQEPVSGTNTVFFRSAYLPPGIRIELRRRADRLSKTRGEPSYLSFSLTIDTL
ncbi:MAG: prepilin-type N-terminal cleavage/methylation domain-containing protein [Candidatus Brocadia sp.]|jgi:type II secretory pathway pseudopilin PulG